jgi:sigma-B regulation protein RsbU (phosphoserine phosphatase)
MAFRVLLCAAEPLFVEDVRQTLLAAGHDVRWTSLQAPQAADLDGLQFIVLEGSQNHSHAVELCRRLRSLLHETFVPILFITDDHGPTARLASLDAGADAYLLRPFVPAELLAQSQALLRIKDLHDRLADKSAEVLRVNKRLQQTFQQIEQELELAQRIQMSFLPQKLPEVGGVRFGVHYALCGRVGGDFYDVFRLDEQHVGFYVADAMGHGVPASLLAIFVKKGVRAKEIFGQTYRLLPPGEVLALLNRDLIGQALSENPFITMAYGLLNFTNGNLTLARAGHPYPLLVDQGGQAELLQSNGSLLGIFEAAFPNQTRGLRAGDKLLFYSDGIDAGRFGDNTAGLASLKACAARHHDQPIQDFVNLLARDLFQHGPPTDDLTLLGLEMLTGSATASS